MNIEHIAMYVNDLEYARDFFVTYLGGDNWFSVLFHQLR